MTLSHFPALYVGSLALVALILVALLLAPALEHWRWLRGRRGRGGRYVR